MNREYHVYRENGEWLVVWSGVRRLESCATQREAFLRAKLYAFQAKGEAVLHGRSGRIRDSWRYREHGGPNAHND